MSTGSARSSVTTYQTEYGTGELVWQDGLLVAHRLPGQRPVGSSAGPGSAVNPAAPELTRLLEFYFTGEAVSFDIRRLPLYLSGFGSFYLRLAAELAGVPYGQTVSYAWLAAAAGRPRAARPAGNFLAANPFPVILPCHRVIRSDGRPGGFSGGRKWKERLLALEKPAGRPG